MINYTNTSSILSKKLLFIRNNYLKSQHQFVSRQESNYNCKYSNKASNITAKLLNFPRKTHNFNNKTEKDKKNYK